MATRPTPTRGDPGPLDPPEVAAAYRSSLRRFRGSLILGAGLLVAAWGAVEASGLPRTAFHGGRRLAEKWARLEELERAGPLEVAVVGASQIDQGFDARRFSEASGERAFNLGVAGTDTYFQSVLLRQLVMTGRKPEAVIWALLDSTLRRSDINRQYLTAPAMSWARGPSPRLSFELGRRLPQFHRLDLRGWWQTLSGRLPEPVDEAGRVHMAAERHPWLADSLEPEPEESLEPEDGAAPAARLLADGEVELDVARAHVEETLELLEELGVRVWFVFTPFAEERLDRRSVHAWRMLTRTRDGHFDWVRELAGRHGIEILDLHACAGISGDASLFYDSSHLNGKGSLRLGELLGELHSGRRHVPEEWRGVPSRAHWLAILGHEPPAVPAPLVPGESVRLADHPAFFPGGARTDLYASVRIAEPGDYRLVLADDAPREREAGCYVRIGDGPHRFWRPKRRQDAVWSLARGEHRIELHAAAGTIDWDELALEPLRRR